ncbi:MAG: hypothetical protein ACE5J4_02390 [Candidatus Aenigmatarchaeota archaeon]
MQKIKNKICIFCKKKFNPKKSQRVKLEIRNKNKRIKVFWFCSIEHFLTKLKRK